VVERVMRLRRSEIEQMKDKKSRKGKGRKALKVK
jgi:hypothetical protein